MSTTRKAKSDPTSPVPPLQKPPSPIKLKLPLQYVLVPCTTEDAFDMPVAHVRNGSLRKAVHIQELEDKDIIHDIIAHFIIPIRKLHLNNLSYGKSLSSDDFKGSWYIPSYTERQAHGLMRVLAKFHHAIIVGSTGHFPKIVAEQMSKKDMQQALRTVRRVVTGFPKYFENKSLRPVQKFFFSPAYKTSDLHVVLTGIGMHPEKVPTYGTTGVNLNNGRASTATSILDFSLAQMGSIVDDIIQVLTAGCSLSTREKIIKSSLVAYHGYLEELFNHCSPITLSQIQEEYCVRLKHVGCFALYRLAKSLEPWQHMQNIPSAKDSFVEVTGRMKVLINEMIESAEITAVSSVDN